MHLRGNVSSCGGRSAGYSVQEIVLFYHVNSRDATQAERLKKYGILLGVVAHTFKPSTWEAETEDLCKFRASLVY